MQCFTTFVILKANNKNREDNMIVIQNFSKTYSKNRYAVKDLNLTIDNGDICAFVGHNGAGKTTTLKCIVGILDFKEGDIFINDKSIKTASLDCKKGIAYIPDNPDIYEHLRGIDYINFIASVFKIPHQKKIELTQRYSEMFEMSQYLNQSINNYSHGMKQKISLIAALIHEPQVLILDEPFVGLDPISTHKLKEEMQRLASNGATILFSTHILDVAEKLCNKIAILKEGKLIYSGKMSELIQNKSLEEIYMEMDNNVELI